MANKPQPGLLEDALRSGRLYELAPQCKSQNELARRLGLSKDAFISQKVRLINRGVYVPSFAELKAANGNAPMPESHGSGRTLTIEQALEEMRSTVDVDPVCGLDTQIGACATHIGYGAVGPRQQENRWPNLAAFDSEPYVTPANPSVKKLTRAECPDGTMILWASDIHIPIHNEPVCRLMVECAERVGVTRVVAGGDILDMNCLSRHAKESKRTVSHATILEEVEPGRWLLDWFASKETDYVLGNHEDRVKRFIDENPAFHGSVVSNFAKLCELPPSINVLPQGGEVRLGNLSMVHGDAEFKNGTGGKHPAAKLLEMFPDQSTICGHLHRMATACRTARDEDGIPRTRRAWTMGHLSIEEMHYGYVSKNPNWQTGFALIRVYWEGDRPRWTVYPIEVLFDRYNRPYFEFENRVYR